MDVAGLDQRTMAEACNKSQVWLQKVLAGENHVRLKDLDFVAAAMRTTAAELVRSDDNRYQLECSPTEVRLIERLRRRPDLFDALMLLLDVRPASVPNQTTLPSPGTSQPDRSPPKPRKIAR
jgi:transcriptional regulator with XRE-family HTH domain